MFIDLAIQSFTEIPRAHTSSVTSVRMTQHLSTVRGVSAGYDRTCVLVCLPSLTVAHFCCGGVLFVLLSETVRVWDLPRAREIRCFTVRERDWSNRVAHDIDLLYLYGFVCVCVGAHG